MNQNTSNPLTAEELYKEYWAGDTELRKKRRYYERLYGHLLHKITFEKESKIIDIAGGNGQNLAFFGAEGADLIDISDSGLEIARQHGFHPIKGDITKRFPIEENAYDTALCFEVLEHLHFPNKTLAEINNILKPGGVLYVGQPNMRADGVYHVRRYYLDELVDDLKKNGFEIEWIDYVPAYTMREAILNDVQKNPSWIRKLIQCVNLLLSFIPWKLRYQMAKWIPNRFALLFVIRAIKIS